jgi:membrane protein
LKRFDRPERLNRTVRVREQVTGRVGAVQGWLARRADTAIGRLALQWFRGYFEASQNSGSAATLYSFLSIAPVVLSVIGLFHAAGANTNAFASHLIDHLDLTGTTAQLVQETFGTASENALAGTLAAMVGFLIWGIGIGQIYQDVYARAWRIHVRTLSDQARFTIWFFVQAGVLAVYVVSAEQLRSAGWSVVIPVWIVGSMVFWLWTPRFLLHRQIGIRPLLPGAILATIVVGGATATSPLFLGSWLNSDGKYFGSFGIVVALLGWAFVMVTISLACAVFSPVWVEWRKEEKNRRSEAQPVTA